MDIIAPLVAQDPASPRLTTYTPSGRMELSAQTLHNWQSKAANLLDSLAPSSVGIACAPGWQPLMVVLGCWRTDVPIIDADSCDVLFTDDLSLAEAHSGEVFLLSDDPFGRGVEESGGELPFGVNDFSPELRVQPDAYPGPVAAPAPAGPRVLVPSWTDTQSMLDTLKPLRDGGSVVMATEPTAEIAAAENAII
ncbi:TIGR03089 family protein [uncultured Corynebacterium sp.]|uniref:TIGR03089 family protein n=1 Tax=uncultured Corynebacterium sp. TaxID=159447 RepID=UPI0025CCCA15|nr:TIGR03089 family protein [uncultured Corynebacterium sp.]